MNCYTVDAAKKTTYIHSLSYDLEPVHLARSVVQEVTRVILGLVTMSTDWGFTNFKLDELDEQFYRRIFDDGGLEYIACQLERCPTTGNLHVQGGIIFSARKRLLTVKKILCQAHWLKRVAGTRLAFVNYHRKDDTAVSAEEGGWRLELGEYKELEQGKRNDLEEIKDEIVAGASMESVFDRHFATSARYYKFFDRYKLMKAKNQDGPPEVYVFWGNTGSGKSREAWTRWPDAYDKSASDWWWDGYDGVSPVIIDEFSGQIPIESILKITDRHPNRVPFKGGMMKFAAKVIVFTSNKEPSRWWPNAENYAAFQRRCKEIKLFE